MSELNQTTQEILDARRDHFETKREQRLERFGSAIQTAESNSQRLWEQSSEGLPPDGEPIKIGHHSEKRHRRALEKSHARMDRAIEESRKAAHYRGKLDAAENNTAISSDDPDAIAKLQAQLDDRKTQQDYMKQVNKLVRSAKVQKMDPDQQIIYVMDQLGCDQEIAISHLQGHGHSFDGAGYPSWKLSNNNASIKRIEKRIRCLEKDLARIEEQGEFKDIRFEDLGLTIRLNNVINRYQLSFDRYLTKDAWELIVKNFRFKKTRDGIFQRQLNTLPSECRIELKQPHPWSLYSQLVKLNENDNLLVPAKEVNVVKTVEPVGLKCGYCGHTEPFNALRMLELCPACTGQTKLPRNTPTEDHLDLIQLIPVDEKRKTLTRPAISEEKKLEAIALITKAHEEWVAEEADTDLHIAEKNYAQRLANAELILQVETWIIKSGLPKQHLFIFNKVQTPTFSYSRNPGIQFNPLDSEWESYKLILESCPFEIEIKD